MRQCRICLETEYPFDMVSPCQCRGSAEFIHRRCLEDHLRYYPDRYCTVCRTRMDYMSRGDFIMLGCVIITCAIYLSVSAIPWIVKLAIAAVLSLSMYIYNLHYLMTSEVSLLTLVFLIGIGMSPGNLVLTSMVSICVIILCLLTIVTVIPPEYVFSFVMTLFMGLYAALFLFSVHAITDAYVTALMFCIIFILWYGAMKFTRRIPVLRI